MRNSSIRRRQAQSRRTVGLFIFGFVGALGLMVFLTFRGLAPEGNRAVQSFNELHRAFATGGIEEFLREKNILRGQVESALRDGNRDAEQIAVYLFPEVLPKQNFEKLAAMELWVPLQRNIERSPQTAASRSWYEEMKATVWNYENADRTIPKISAYAQQVLRIYGAIANP